MVNEKKIIINEFKTRTIFPFYIDKINKAFYGKINNSKNKNLVNKILPKIKENLDIDEISKIFESDNLLDIPKIKKILNCSIKNILSIINNKNGLFDPIIVKKNDEIIYLQEKKDIAIFEAVGNLNSSKRFNFALNINKNNSIFNLVEQIQISFYLDRKNNMITGGVSFNWGNNNSKDYPYKKINDRIYISNLIKVFITDELKNLSLNTMISLFFDLKKTNSKNKKINSKNKNDLINFKNKWVNLINNKYLSFLSENEKNKVKKYYEDDIFYQMLTLLIINLIVYEDMKIYFRNKSPHVILSLTEKTIMADENKNLETNNFEEYFNSLIEYTKQKYFNFSKIKLNNIKTADDALILFAKFNNIDNYSFGYPIITYELTRSSDIPFLDEDSDIFLGSNYFKIIFLLILAPELFGLNNTQNNFIEYDEYVNFINFKKWNKDFDEKIEQIIDKTICEWNYDYITFINKELSFLIIKNDNSLNYSNNSNIYEKDPSRKLFNNYLWSQIFIQSRIWKLKNCDEEFDKIKNTCPSLLRSIMNEVQNLQFDWNENFYGIPEIKLIIKKMNNITDVKLSIISFLKKINDTDRIYGKSKERRYLGLALTTACLFGFLDFFTMIFTVVAVDNPLNSLNPASISIISVGSFLTMGLLIILITTLLKPIFNKKKYFQNNKG